MALAIASEFTVSVPSHGSFRPPDGLVPRRGIEGLQNDHLD
jgi:hypothetical protein